MKTFIWCDGIMGLNLQERLGKRMRGESLTEEEKLSTDIFLVLNKLEQTNYGAILVPKIRGKLFVYELSRGGF